MRAIVQAAGEAFGQVSFDEFLSVFSFSTVSEPSSSFDLSVAGAWNRAFFFLCERVHSDLLSRCIWFGIHGELVHLAEAPTPMLNLADAVMVRALFNDAIDLTRAQPKAQVDISYADVAAIASTVAAMNVLLEQLRHKTMEHPFTVEVRA